VSDENSPKPMEIPNQHNYTIYSDLSGHIYLANLAAPFLFCYCSINHNQLLLKQQ
jgi:hypothetical protein